ncbi:MAG: 4Fe-4S dicluster domain-containing protein [Acidimicrobiia bacterium]
MSTPFVLDRDGLDALIGALAAAGYEVYGPTVRDGSIVYDRILGIADLPAGVGDEQEGGEYRLTERPDDALFGYAVGPSSLKSLLYPSHRTVWTAELNGSLRFTPAPVDEAPRAVVGVRSCELAAMEIQDRVLLGNRYRDPDYESRRDRLFTVAVDCTAPAATCFCASMGTGPAATESFDLALVEVLHGEHRFVGRVGSDRGIHLLKSVNSRPASEVDLAAAVGALDAAEASMTRTLDPAGAAVTLRAGPDHPHWAEIARRCLACGNCTQVCPTCFCVTTQDTAALDGSTAARTRHWDSCFSLDFSFMGGRPVRHTIDARYRQWLTHKLSTWYDQFGTSGCVGCGRCITWCPVGIDLTAEVPALAGREVVRG